MKKFTICIMLVISCLYAIPGYSASENFYNVRSMLVELNIVDEDSFSNTDSVTRGECIVAIMKAIGVTDEDVSKLNGADIYTFVDVNSFSYFGCAYRSKIAFGIACKVDRPTYRTSHTHKKTDLFFFPGKKATIKEVLAFMVRCLEESDENTDLNITQKKAFDLNLIHSDDLFIQNPDFEISQEDFCLLMERFLRQKRYKYYQRENGIFMMEGNVDEERSISYLYMLQQRRNT